MQENLFQSCQTYDAIETLLHELCEDLGYTLTEEYSFADEISAINELLVFASKTVYTHENEKLATINDFKQAIIFMQQAKRRMEELAEKVFSMDRAIMNLSNLGTQLQAGAGFEVDESDIPLNLSTLKQAG